MTATNGVVGRAPQIGQTIFPGSRQRGGLIANKLPIQPAQRMQCVRVRLRARQQLTAASCQIYSEGVGGVRVAACVYAGGECANARAAVYGADALIGYVVPRHPDIAPAPARRSVLPQPDFE